MARKKPSMEETLPKTSVPVNKTPALYKQDESFRPAIPVSEIHVNPLNPRRLDLQVAGIMPESVKAFGMEAFKSEDRKDISWLDWACDKYEAENPDSEEFITSEWLSLFGLAATIYESGIHTPVSILIGPDKNKRELIFGERRILCCLMMGVTTVPATVRQEISAQEMRSAMFSENSSKSPSSVSLLRSLRALDFESPLSVRGIMSVSGLKRTSSHCIHKILQLDDATFELLNARIGDDLSLTFAQLDRLRESVLATEKKSQSETSIGTPAVWNAKLPKTSPDGLKRFLNLIRSAKDVPEFTYTFSAKPVKDWDESECRDYLKKLLAHLDTPSH